MTIGNEIHVAVFWGRTWNSWTTLLGVTVQPTALSLQMSFGPYLLTHPFVEKTSPLPIHLPFLPVYGRAVGEGHSSQEPHADAVRNIGFNELQNEVAAADMYGCPHQSPPPSPSIAS